MKKELATFSLLMTITLMGCTADKSAPSGPHLIDVGGHRLEVKVMGQGSPTIILESGLGDTMDKLQTLQRNLARTTRVVCYNRAGYGQSGAGPLPRDSERTARELKLLLEKAKIEGPYLLVGHSLGALNVMLFAQQYPAVTAGLVLLDPPPLGFAIGKDYLELQQMAQSMTEQWQNQADQLAQDPKQKAQAAFMAAIASEHREMARSAGMVDQITSLGTLPLTVMATGQTNPAFGTVAEEFQKYWITQSRALCAKSKVSRFILVEESRHHLYLDAPEKVELAIREMIIYSRLPTTEIKNLARLQGPYLGQTPPELESKMFAPGFISTDFGELNAVFSSNGQEFYFSRRGIPGKSSAILVTKQVNGRWTEPQALPFCGQHDDVDLFLCPDNERLIFCSDRPLDPIQKIKDPREHDFWISIRNKDSWSPASPFATPAMSSAEDYFPIVTISGNLYLNSQREGRGTNNIYKSILSNGQYGPAQKLPSPINTAYREYDAFVCPDERTILFSSERPGGFGRSDIYVSFLDSDQTWTEPINLGPQVNSIASEYGASLSPDGRFFFFTSGKAGSEDIYWISAELIQTLRTSPKTS